MLGKRKFTKNNPRRSRRLVKKQKILVELPYEIWLYIANFVGTTPLHNLLKYRKAWTTNHLLFMGLIETMDRRIHRVLSFLNFNKLCLYPQVTSGRNSAETQKIIKNFPKPYEDIISTLHLREQMTQLQHTTNLSLKQRLGQKNIIARKFCRIWFGMAFEKNTLFSNVEFTQTLSGAGGFPRNPPHFWDFTHVFSIRISSLFLLCHYDFHLKVFQEDPKKTTEIRCCLPGKWECEPACEHRRWPTWALMELRSRLKAFSKHGLVWLFKKNTSQVASHLYTRYCTLNGEASTFTHVYVGVDCLSPPG